LDGFELNALDYLVKPISFDRFVKAALKAKDYYELRQQNKETKSTVVADHLFIKEDSRLTKIFLDDILFVEALQNYVSIHTATRKHITYLTFAAIEAFLPPERFIKTHKSYIVAAAKVDSIEGTELRIGPHHIPVSRALKDTVLQTLLGDRYLRRP